MPWTFDAKRKQYISPSGRRLNAKATAQLRNNFAAARSEIARTMAEQYASGVMNQTEFASQFEVFISDTMTAGYMAGRGGANALVDADLESIFRLIDDQLGFADAFAKELPDLSADDIANRASLYGDAAIGSFEQGQAAGHGVDLPGYPGDWETACKCGCRCYWEIETNSDNETTYRWITASDGEVCEDCARRGQEWNPWVPG